MTFVGSYIVNTTVLKNARKEMAFGRGEQSVFGKVQRLALVAFDLDHMQERFGTLYPAMGFSGS